MRGRAVQGSQLTGRSNIAWLDGERGFELPASVDFVTLLHMHEAGVHMTATIEGPNGARTLHDEPFDFNFQTTYQTSEVLMPGERIVTTCNFSKPSCVGQSTDMEMCYLFTYAYPKHALSDNGLWGTLAHGEDACLGQ